MEAMTLEQVRDWHLKQAATARNSLARLVGDKGWSGTATAHDAMAHAIDAHLSAAQACVSGQHLGVCSDCCKPAHLAQPAQAVDVGAIREVIEDLREWGETDMQLAMRAATLTRALSGEKAAPVGDGLVPVREALLRHWLRELNGARRGNNAEACADYLHGSIARQLEAASLPASPAPDKEG